MSYIGKTPIVGNFVKLDAISVVNGQAAYTMQNGGVNFTSYDNVNQFLVSLNGILQSPTDSFTVSGSTLTFASNLSTGDVIDFVMVLGNTLDVGTPSDNTVSTAKLQDNAITSAKLASGAVPNQSAFKNIIINGDMSIAQRGTSSSITTSGYYTVDRFNMPISNMGTFTVSQSTDTPSGQGFSTSSKYDCTTADASPASGDFIRFEQYVEAQNLQYLKFGTSNAQSLTLSFWVKSTKTGTYIAELRNFDGGRTICNSYTINASNTWEKKTITVSGDTSGSFNNDNGLGLACIFWLGAGSDFTSGTLATDWEATTSANRAVGQVNLADSTSNEWYVTGVQLEAGTTASDFEFLPFDANLQRCQRYYYAHAVGGQVIGLMWWYQSGVNNTVIHFPVEMRTAPSVSTTSGTNYYRVLSNGSATDFNSLSGLQDGSTHATTIDSGLSGTGSQVGRVKCNNDGRVLFSAEL